MGGHRHTPSPRDNPLFILHAPQALGPRQLPTEAVVTAELRRMAIENGEDPDMDSTASRDANQTSLANNPSDYFGMVG